MIYKPKGVCSREIHIEVDGDKIIRSVKFVGGRSGNSIGISQLVQGMSVNDAVQKLRGKEITLDIKEYTDYVQPSDSGAAFSEYRNSTCRKNRQKTEKPLIASRIEGILSFEF